MLWRGCTPDAPPREGGGRDVPAKGEPDVSPAEAAKPVSAAELRRSLAVLPVSTSTEDQWRVDGVVQDEQGAGIPGATVFTYGGDGWDPSRALNDAGPLRTATTDAEGRFSLPLPVVSEWEQVFVSARAETFLPAGGITRRERGSDVWEPILVRLVKGLDLSGRVVKEDGQPVADLVVIATQDQNLGDSSFASAWSLSRTAHQLPPPGYRLVETSAITGADGTFRLQGLPGGEFWLATGSPEWVVRQPQQARAGERDVSVVVHGRVCLEVVATDAKTGKAVSDLRMRTESTRTETSGRIWRTTREGAGGREKSFLAWREEGDWATLDVKLVVLASGYDRCEQRTRITPSETHVSVAVSLSPSTTERVTATLVGSVQGGRPLADECEFHFKSEGVDEWHKMAHTHTALSTFDVALPPKSGQLMVRMSGAPACGVQWTQPFDARSSAGPTSFELPQFGTLEIDVRRVRAGGAYLLKLNGPGIDYATSRSVDELRFHGVAVGSWRVSVTVGGSEHVREVTIEDGQSAPVAF